MREKNVYLDKTPSCNLKYYLGTSSFVERI